MAAAKLSPEKIDLIKASPFDETVESVARRVGCSVPTVRRYRQELRQDRQEATKERIAEHAVAHVTDALADLGELRMLAKEEFKAQRKAPLGALWLDSIKTELAVSAGQDKPREFDGLSNEELEAIAAGVE